MSARALSEIALAILLSTITFAQTNARGPASTNASPSQEPAPEARGRLLKQTFTDYTIMLFAATGEPWLASWNDSDQIAIFENPTNRVVITAQYLKFPLDLTFKEAAGNRDAFMDNALRKYCAIQLARSRDPAITSQPIEIQGRIVGDHSFRFCRVVGRDSKARAVGISTSSCRGLHKARSSRATYWSSRWGFRMGLPTSKCNAHVKRLISSCKTSAFINLLSFPVEFTLRLRDSRLMEWLT